MIVAVGEVDVVTAPLLREFVLDTEDAVVVLDLSRITFFAVAGMRVLLEAADRARTRGQGLSVIESSMVRRVLQATGAEVVVAEGNRGQRLSQ